MAEHPVHEVRVARFIAAPIARVFEVLADHETFIRDALTRTRVVVPGSPTRNALGAQREVRAPLIRFVEEVTVWEPPRHYTYLIRSSTLPIRHHGGGLTLTERDGGTDVDWQTRFEVPVPVLGKVLGPAMRLTLGRVFAGLLASAKRRLER